MAFRGGEFVTFSVSISISGASRNTFAAVVKFVRALAGIGAAWFLLRKGGFLGLFVENISSSDGRYGEEEDIQVGSKVRDPEGDDMNMSVADMAMR
jgi:hypothetical protein